MTMRSSEQFLFLRLHVWMALPRLILFTVGISMGKTLVWQKNLLGARFSALFSTAELHWWPWCPWWPWWPWWKLSSDKSYLVERTHIVIKVLLWWKPKKSQKWNGVIACNILPVAMFYFVFVYLPAKRAWVSVGCFHHGFYCQPLLLQPRKIQEFFHILAWKESSQSINHRHRHSWAKMLLNYPSVMWDS